MRVVCYVPRLCVGERHYGIYGPVELAVQRREGKKLISWISTFTAQKLNV